MSQALLQMLSAGGASQPIYSDDVFSAYTRTGTGASQVTTTNIDMTQGYMLWSKGRSGATDHAVYDSVRGTTKDLVANTTAAETTQAQGLTAVSATGHTFGTLAKVNTSTATYVDWVFRKAAKFFTQATVTVSGSNQTVDLSSLGTVGMVIVKRTDSTGSWYVYHRSATAGKLLILETTAAEATLGHITLSGTTLTLVQATIGNGTYIVYAWAHDSDTTNGIVQCGSYATNGGGVGAATLGWEPQYVLVKRADSTSGWHIVDTSRAFVAWPGGTTSSLVANSSVIDNALGQLAPTATGISDGGAIAVSATMVYMAIRRPNKPPTVGTQVYAAIARTGTGAVATMTGVGFAPDLMLNKPRSNDSGYSHLFHDRLRGAGNGVNSSATSAELAPASIAGEPTSFTMDGVAIEADAGGGENYSGWTYINHFFKRALGVFDEVCYTGTGSAKTEAHNLTVAPEFWIVKGRSGATAWAAGCTALANTEYLVPNTTAAKASGATYWNSTFPTSSVFSVGTAGDVNTSAATYVAYLFATKAGISKVGSYTGNGTTNAIDCGFTTGARFVMIKRTDSTGDWYVWDTIRGIIAGNDPYLLLNSTAAEVTSTDYIDPSSAGFELSSTAPAAINANGGNFIYLAFA